MLERDPNAPSRRRRLRIGIDAHAIGERKTGNERFVANLIPALRARSEHELVLYVTTDAAEGALRARRLERTLVRRVRPATPLVRIPLGLPALAARDRLDAVLVQYTAGPWAPCPVVTVVHDVAFRRHPEFFSPFERRWMNRAIPFTMRRAAGIVTVSRFSRDEIVACFGIDPARIAIAHEAADAIFSRPPSVGSGVDPPYVLAAGNLQPRKNLGVLIRAFRELAREVPERLVVAGQPSLGAETLRREAGDLERSGKVTFTGYVSDERLVALVAGASAFAFPSLYEGFGLPVIEAMAAGTPALVSDIPVMREVAGDAAIRLPPGDPSAWARAIAELSSLPERRAELAAAGRRRAEAFSWDATADAVVDAIERAAAGGGSHPWR
jgi:glycosyltransferase involved in cell wall biosynthesis